MTALSGRYRRTRHAPIGVALLLLLVSLVSASSAGTVAAATPVAPAIFYASSAHGRYVVELDVSSPRAVKIDVTTRDLKRAKCPYAEYEFTHATLTKSGAFHASGYFSETPPQLHFTVTGSFTSSTTAHGTVVGNYGCGTDSFTISLPVTVALGDRPTSVAVDPVSGDVYVAARSASFAGVVYVIRDDKIVHTIHVGDDLPNGLPNDLVVDTTTNTIYVTVYNLTLGSGVDIIDGRTDTVTGFLTGVSGPGGFDARTNTLYFGGYNAVSVVSGSTNKVTDTIGVSYPTSVGVDSLTDRIYVAGGAFGYTDDVWVINGGTDKLVGTVDFADYPEGLGVDTATNTIYVSTYESTVSIIKGATNKVTSHFSITGCGPEADALEADASRGIVYVACAGGATGSVFVINARTDKVITFDAVDTSSPEGLALDPANHDVYVVGPSSIQAAHGYLYVLKGA